jgi:hypothetical protein
MFLYKFVSNIIDISPVSFAKSFMVHKQRNFCYPHIELRKSGEVRSQGLENNICLPFRMLGSIGGNPRYRGENIMRLNLDHPARQENQLFDLFDLF